MKQKVLIVHHSGQIGGAGRSMLVLTDTLVKMGASVVVACPEFPVDMSRLAKKRCKVLNFSSDIALFPYYSGGASLFSIATLKNLFKFPKFKNEITSLVTLESPDIIIINSMTLSYLGKYIKRQDNRIICFVRETVNKNSKYIP